MDARQFLKKYGSERAEKVAIAAGSNLAYFKQIAYGARRPGPKLSRRLAKASGYEITAHELRPDYFDPPPGAGP